MALRSKLAVESEISHFDRIKKRIASDVKLCSESYCVEVAKLMVKLLTDGEEKSISQSSCRNQNVFHKKDGNFTTQFLQRLLDQSYSTDHLVFHFSLPIDLHDFVIYKECNGKEISYRVIQSCLAQYSIGSWLGVSYSPDGFEEWADYQEFGDGKKVTADQILKFLQNIYQNYGERGSKLTHVNIYVVPPKLLNSNQEKEKMKNNLQIQHGTQIKSLIESRVAFDYYQPSLDKLLDVKCENTEVLKLLLTGNSKI